MEKKPKMTDGNKKFKIEDLPQDIDNRHWCRTFVPTFMMYIARLDNPFDHNVKAGCAAMQKIWNVVFEDTPYTVTQSSAVYQLVRYYFQFITIFLFIYLQTMQRVCDSWRSTMGSTAIAAVLAFCSEEPALKNSDANCQEFAMQYLEHLRFLYEKSDSDDVKVSTTTNINYSFTISMNFIEIQGSFPWPFHFANIRFSPQCREGPSKNRLG
jgi:hypothetical protein